MTLVDPRWPFEVGERQWALGVIQTRVSLRGHRRAEGLEHLALSPGRIGTTGEWLVGQEGAILVRPGHRVHCFCVRVGEAGDLPPADRVAHLVLALREDEQGFATVANRNFSGATWRLKPQLPAGARPALKRARDLA